MKKEQIVTGLITIVLVIVGTVVANSLLTFRQVDASGKVLPDGQSFKPKFGFRRK